MSAKVFEYSLKIREGHLDTFGHVNNAVYLEIYEEARWDVLNSSGFSIEDIRKTALGPVVLELNLKFKKELRLHDNITIRSQMKSVQGKIAILGQNMINHTGEICCEAEFTIGLFDLRTRRLVDPTPEWRKAMGME